MSDAVIVKTPPKNFSLHDRFESLKIGSCITSSWFFASTAVLASLQAFDTPGKLVFGGLTVLTGGLLTGLGAGLIARKMPTDIPVTETEKSLDTFIKRVASDFNIKDNLSIHFLGEEEMQGRALAQFNNNMFVNQERFKVLPKSEGIFTVVHDLAHAFNLDTATTNLANFSKNVSLMALPVGAIGLASSVLSPAFATAAAGFAAATFLHVGTKLLGSTAQRIKEKRADRIAINFTHDPISAIAAIDKLHPPADNPFLEPFSHHPTRNERVRAIVQHFNKNWPDYAIAMTEEDRPGTPTSARRERVLKLDAAHLGNQRYIFGTQGFAADLATPEMA